MSHLPEKFVLSTKECHAVCGSEAIFEELEALYGSTLLKPLRVLPNNSRSWCTDVVRSTMMQAQDAGVLQDRPYVEAAVEKLREKKRRTVASKAG